VSTSLMGKTPKRNSASNASGQNGKDLNACISKGEELLEAGDFQSALACFDEALKAQATSQLAWYLRGVAGAELWEQADLTPCSQRAGLLRLACESFERVLTLDSSNRSENRYLSALACAKVLTSAASALEDEDDNSTAGGAEASSALAIAYQNFEEGERLHKEWGHPSLGSEALGTWGQAVAHQMRIQIAQIEESVKTQTLPGASAFIDVSVVQRLGTLCEAASAKFKAAVEVSPDIEEEDETADDMHWITLHVEHLLAFVEIVRSLLSSRALAPSIVHDSIQKANIAWREAASLSDANLFLSDAAQRSWKPLALRGDVLAGAASFLGAVSLHQPDAALVLPSTVSSPGCFVEVEAHRSAATPSSSLLPHTRSAGEHHIREHDAVALAEVAFADALRVGGVEATSTVGLSVGALFLEHARRLKAKADTTNAAETVECLKRASNALQSVTALNGDSSGLGPADLADAKATAWYNLACVASILGKGEHAAEALQAALKQVPPHSRAKWCLEASQDEDLAQVREHGNVKAALSLR